MDIGEGSNKTIKKDAEPASAHIDVQLPAGKNPKTSSKRTHKIATSKGIENAKKRLRAFSIQKKTHITPIVPKAPTTSNTGTTTVIIGKLSGVKAKPPIEPDPELKKLKPPKPGASRRSIQDSYTELQKRTLSEIEDMKRKMELVELGIPLGLICPTSTSEKAMPTKAMPPIKSFLDPDKVDELIREAKKAKQQGKDYKFNYQKLLPDYANPFQKKKEEMVIHSSHEKERKFERRRSESERDKRRVDKYDTKRHDHKKEKYKDRDKDKSRHDDSHKYQSDDKETDVNLNDYLVCDSWSLDNDDKNSSSSPKIPDKPSSFIASATTTLDANISLPPLPPEPITKLTKKVETLISNPADSPTPATIKIEKLQPVMDSFKYEIDPNDDEILDIFDEDSETDRYAHQTKAKHRSFYDSPDKKNIVDYEPDDAKDSSMDGLNDDTFLESVINEIKQEHLSDDECQDKGLVEYEMSPTRDEESPEISKSGSVTPEIDDSIRIQSQRSDYSEGYRSTDSFKSVETAESGYKSVESFRLSVEKELDEVLEAKMSKSTVDSLETWSFVLKICQPLLFRHDKNKCFKETHTNPKIWYTENPKVCNCVKDRSVVYEELEMCKMGLVDRVYGCDQISDAPFPKARKWYPKNSLCVTENAPVQLSSDWEAEDRCDITTPQRCDEMSLDREYQRFMEAVWPDVAESKKDTSRSTTPVRQESRKKKKEEDAKDIEEKKPKKIKLSSEGWSQESDMEEEDKSKKQKMEKEKAKSRKRKHSPSPLSSSLSDTDEEVRKKRKLLKKKALKKAKSKSSKSRRMGRKILKKLKVQQKKRNKEKENEEDDIDKKKEKKIKKKIQQKAKKKALKKKKAKSQSSSSSSSSSDSSDSESENERKMKKAKKKAQEGKKKKVKKQRKPSSSDSSQSEELFDVNILNNIKTERLTDDEIAGHKMMEFSPRRQKPREIINVKELQNDFVENIHIKEEKQDVEDIPKQTYVEVQKEELFIPLPDSCPIYESLDTPSEIELPKGSPQPVKMLETPPLPAPAAPPPVPPPAPTPVFDESNMSQASSQDSVFSVSVKDAPIFYEKDESHLRPSSQNSNYSFNDVINASQNNAYQKEIKTTNQNTLYDKDVEMDVEQNLYSKDIETISTGQSDYGKRIEVTTSENALYGKELEVGADCDDKYGESYEAANYEMYEQMAMAYQSDVASQQRTSPEVMGVMGDCGTQRIETVVGANSRGEIKCDWRAGDAPTTPHLSQRPSRWGLKPSEVNIVLTGGSAPSPVQEEANPVYHIQSLANRTDICTGYDEAYMDMYGASDRLQYGDCFGDANDINIDNITPVSIDISLISPNIKTVSPNIKTISESRHTISPNIKTISVSDDSASPIVVNKEPRISTLDDRISKALRETVLGGITKDIDVDKETPDKGILVTSIPVDTRGGKRVSFADGYKPGQDSDVEEPPAKKRKRGRRLGCAWPCPATHADHVPLWDALPPPPPPPGSPPRAHPLRVRQVSMGGLLAMPASMPKFDSIPMQGFMPPEPPPGLIALQ